MKTATASRASTAQLAADNYRKPHRFPWRGLQIVIETPKGARRRPGWPRMSCAYGDIKRTTGADGDAVDVFVGPNRSGSDLVVIIDQVTPGGRFDEHKVLIGFNTTADAVKAYRRCYSKGWKVGPVTTMTVDQFKAWLAKGDQAKRVAGQVHRFAALCSTFGEAVDSYDTQLGFNWEESSRFDESKHPRDAGGQFAVGDTVSVPSYANVEGQWSKTGESKLTVSDPHEHERVPGRSMVWLRREDGSKLARMPADSVGQFQDDLQGRVNLPAMGHPSIDAVTSGKAKFLGKGDDGLAFDSGDGNVVKVSTTVPYIPENDAHRTPAEARQMMAKATAANQAMIDAGHGDVLLPQQYVEHGEKGITVMPRVDTAASYSKEQLDQFAGKMAKLHADGFRIGDTIQTGLATDGTIRVYDTGKARKAKPRGPDDPPDFDLQDEQGYISGLYHDANVYDHEGEQAVYKGLDKQTDSYLEMSEEIGRPAGPPSHFGRLHKQYLDMVANDHDLLAFIGDDHFKQMTRAEKVGFPLPEGWQTDAAAHAKEWNQAETDARPGVVGHFVGPQLDEPPANQRGETFADCVDWFGAQMTFKWDEAKHPRKPAGDGGGEFTESQTSPAAASGQQTDSPQFWAWFGESKIVDGDGRPQVIFHGTSGEFDTFDEKLSGQRDDSFLGKGHYFTNYPERAAAYAESAKGGNANIKPVYLSIKNPFYLQLGQNAPPQTELIERGFDGVILDLGPDDPHFARIEGREPIKFNEWEIVAFSPTQIKSATGNRGTFDPADERITHAALTFGDAVDSYDTQLELPGWRTIGANKDNPKGQQGGTPVYMQKGGQITAGPAALEGKNVNELGAAEKGRGGESEPPPPKPGQRFAEAVTRFFKQKQEAENERVKALNADLMAPSMSAEERVATKKLDAARRAGDSNWQEHAKALTAAQADYQVKREAWEQRQLNKALAEMKAKNLKGKKPHEMSFQDYSLSKADEIQRQLTADIKKWGGQIKDYQDAWAEEDWDKLTKVTLAMEARHGFKALTKRYSRTNPAGITSSIADAFDAFTTGDRGKVNYNDIQNYDLAAEHEASAKKAMAQGVELIPSVVKDYEYKEWIDKDTRVKFQRQENVSRETHNRTTIFTKEEAHRGRLIRQQSNDAIESTRAGLVAKWSAMHDEHEKLYDDSALAYWKAKEKSEPAIKAMQQAVKDKLPREELVKLQGEAASLAEITSGLQDKKISMTALLARTRREAIARDLSNLARGDGRPMVDKLSGGHDGIKFDQSGSDSTPSPEWRDKLLQASGFINSFISPEVAGRVKVNIHAGAGRANATTDTIHLFDGDGVRTIIHEIGHVIEGMRDGQLEKKSKAFLQAAVQKEDVQHYGSNYKVYEVGSKDGFLNKYTGKAYASATEILSMGLQHLYEDPADFAAKSPDHFNYTIAAIRGLHQP